MVNYFKKYLLLEGLTLAIFLLIFVDKVCVFVSRAMKIVTFLLKKKKKRDTAKRVVDCPRERDTFRNKIM